MLTHWFIALVLGVLACSGAANAQAQDNRVALVIGNSAYRQAPLRNPYNDARDIAIRLRALGFSVIEREVVAIVR